MATPSEEIFPALQELFPTATFDELVRVLQNLTFDFIEPGQDFTDEQFAELVETVRNEGLNNESVKRAALNVSPKLVEAVDPFLAIPSDQVENFELFLGINIRNGVIDPNGELDNAERQNLVAAFEATLKQWEQQTEDAALLGETPPGYEDSLLIQIEEAGQDRQKVIDQRRERKQQVDQARLEQDIADLARAAARSIVGDTANLDAEQLDEFEKLVNNIQVEMLQRIKNEGLDRLVAADRSRLFELGQAQAQQFVDDAAKATQDEQTARVFSGQEGPPAPPGSEGGVSGPQSQAFADKLASGGLTAEQRAQQEANLNKDTDFLGDLAPVLASEEDGAFANFVLRERGSLESRFRTQEQEKADELRRRANAPAFQGTNFGAGSFAPGTFTDFVTGELEGLREIFNERRRQRVTAPANRPIIL